MRIAYFINRYPEVSHSFIRREITELEKQGVDVIRFSIHRGESDLVDPRDLNELQHMHYLKERGAGKILRCVLWVLLGSPVNFVKALLMAISMGRDSSVGVVKHLFYLTEACILGAWVQEYHVKHIHAHFGTNPAAVVLLVKLLYGISYSFTVHGPIEFDAPEALSLGKKIEYASFVVAISSFCRSQMFRWCGHDCWKKIHIVHCALGEDFLSAKATPVPDNRRLVCVGRLGEQKGQLLLIEAVHRLKEQGCLFDLVLAGDGPMRQEIEHLIDHYGLSDQVNITGWISGEQVLQEIAASRALVLPSFAEGLPVVIMEACALRRPVLTTYIAGIPELIHHSESGFLIPAGSVDAIATMLLDLLEMDASALNAIGENAYKCVYKDHNIHTECVRLKSLFQTAVDNVEN